jgi:predicted ATPase
VEASRAVIQHAADLGEEHPWRDPREFALRMLEWDIRSYRKAEDQGPVFFDRGIPDIAGYLTLVGRPMNGDVDRAARTMRYNRTVFLAPPWKKIYRQDAERTQTFQEAEATCWALAAAYRAYGYELVELPKTAVEERVDFVLEAARSAL